MPVAFWLTLLLATLSGSAFLLAPRDNAGRMPLLSAYTIVLFLFLIYIVFPGLLALLNGEAFIWAPSAGGDRALSLALLYGLIALLGFCLGAMSGRALVGRWRSSLPQTQYSRVEDTCNKAPRFLLWVLLAAGLCLKVYLIASTGGIEATILRMSGGGVYDDVEAFNPDALIVRGLSGTADFAAVWLLLDAIRTRKGRAAYASLYFLVLAVSYVTVGKRLTLILPILAVLVGYSVIRKTLTTRLAPLLLIGFLGFGMVTLLIRSFIPASIANADINLDNVSYAQGSVFAFYFNSLEFSTVEMVSFTLQERDQLNAALGGPALAFMQTNVIPFSYPIPRSVWFNKPSEYFDLSYVVSSLLHHQRVTESSVGYVTTLIGNSFVAMGLFGVIASFVLFGFASALVDSMLKIPNWSASRIVAYAFFLMLCFHFFRMGTLAWTFLIGVVQQDGFLLGLLAATSLLAIRKLERRRVSYN